MKNLHGYQRQPLLACTGVARGLGAPGELSWSEMTEGLKSPITWSGSESLGVSSRSFNGHPRGLYLASSGGGLVADSSLVPSAVSSDVCAPIRLVRSRAWQLYTASAYLHQYAHYGMEDPKAALLEAFAIVEQTVHVYSKLNVS